MEGRHPRRLGPSPAVHLAMCAQHTMEAGLTGDVVGQCRDNPRRRRLDEARFIGDLDDPGPFSLARRVRRDRTIGIRPPIAPKQTVTLERWRVDALANGAAAGSQRWTAAARLQAVVVTAAMGEAARSAWCREQGLYLAELDALEAGYDRRPR
jgi:hypothetical protein